MRKKRVTRHVTVTHRPQKKHLPPRRGRGCLYLLLILAVLALVITILPSSPSPLLTGLVAVLLIVATFVFLHYFWKRSEPTFVRDKRYIPDDVRQVVLERDHWRCSKCGSENFLEIDHIIPISRGGSSRLQNLQVLCRDCNRAKSSR
jgi:HNH endonuclease